MKKNYTIPILIFSIITAILATGLFVFFFKVIKNKNQHASVVLATLQGKMQEKENAIIFAKQIAEIKLLQDSINSYFVDPNKIDTFVDYLEKIGSSFKSEVLVKNIEIPPKTENTITFKLSITGTFGEVMSTITFLENIPYQISITQVSLNKETEQSEQENTETTIQEKVSGIPKWQADVSFNILSLD